MITYLPQRALPGRRWNPIDKVLNIKRHTTPLDVIYTLLTLHFPESPLKIHIKVFTETGPFWKLIKSRFRPCRCQILSYHVQDRF